MALKRDEMLPECIASHRTEIASGKNTCVPGESCHLIAVTAQEPKRPKLLRHPRRRVFDPDKRCNPHKMFPGAKRCAEFALKKQVPA